jgi:topoisomerase IA-like protein
MARYGATASEKVRKTMHEEKRGELKSGRSGKTVTSRKQAIAIGLSEARRAGGKVPAKTSSPARKSAGGRKTTARKTTARKTTARKTPIRKTTRKIATRRAAAA